MVEYIEIIDKDGLGNPPPFMSDLTGEDQTLIEKKDRKSTDIEREREKIDSHLEQIIKEATTTDEAVQGLISEYGKCQRQEQRFGFGADLTIANFSITKGKILNQICPIVRKNKKISGSVDEFLETFSGASKRSRKNWRLMARRTDCHDFTYLGVVLILKMIQAAGKKSIPDFLKENGIDLSTNCLPLKAAILEILKTSLPEKKKIRTDAKLS
jgi:hypothetical protein